MKRVLGFDASSSTIGYCILDIDGYNIQFVHANYIKPPKKGNIIERIAKTRQEVQEVIQKYKPDYVGIEEIIQFMAGASTAKTIIMLTTFNRMVGLAAYDCLKKLPEMFNVVSIRHGLKLDKELPKKENIPQLVSAHLGITFPYEYDKKGKVKVESFDMADGVAVALYYAFVLTGRVIRKVKKKVTRKAKKK